MTLTLSKFQNMAILACLTNPRNHSIGRYTRFTSVCETLSIEQGLYFAGNKFFFISMKWGFHKCQIFVKYSIFLLFRLLSSVVLNIQISSCGILTLFYEIDLLCPSGNYWDLFSKLFISPHVLSVQQHQIFN